MQGSTTVEVTWMSFSAGPDVVSMAVLRASRTESSAAWWSEATAAAASAPDALRAILRGRNRVELYDEEALEILDWARRLPGWEGANPKPLIVRRPSH